MKIAKFLVKSSAASKITGAAIKKQSSKVLKRSLLTAIGVGPKERAVITTFLGNYEELGFGASLSKAAIHYMRRSLNENVPMLSMIKMWKKEGFSAAIKRFIFNVTIPQEIKKFYFFFLGMKSEQKKMIASANEEAINDPLITNEQKLEYLYRVDRILGEVGSAESGMTKEQVLKTFFNFDIKFFVTSPQTGNFAQGVHLYNLYKQNYTLPIRSGSGLYVKNYTYHMITLDIIKLALVTHDYGVVIFNRIRSD